MINTSRTFLVPWERTDLTYDAILSISLTLHSDSVNVYLTEYRKENNQLKLSLALEDQPLASIHTDLSQGIQVIQLPTNEILLNGSITVISTNTNEIMTTPKVQISPRFINIYDTTNNNIAQFININDEACPLNQTGIVFDNAWQTLNTPEKLIVNYNSDMTPEVIEQDTSYIRSVNGTKITLDENGVGTYTLQLDSWFKVTGGDGIAWLTGNTQNTCKASDVASNLFSPLNHDPEVEYPLDICFDKYELDLSRLDNFQFTHEKLKWYQLSEDHGDGGTDDGSILQ